MSRRWHKEGQEWPQWSPGQWPKDTKKKGAGKGGGKEPHKKANDKQPVVRAYDTGASSSAPSSADGATPQDGGMQEFFKEFAQVARQMNQPLPDRLKQFLPNTDREEIKTQQRKLNRLRNLRNRIESKQKAIKNDNASWESWLKEIKESIVQQRKQHEDNQERLETELKALMKEEEDLKNGNEEEEDMQEEEEDPEMMVDELMTKRTAKQHEKNIDQIKEELQQNMEVQYQQRMMIEREMMQKEFQKLLHQVVNGQQAAPQVIELDAATTATAEQLKDQGGAPPGLPNGMEAQIASAKAALVPFGVARRAKTTPATSPYGRKEKDEDTEKVEEKEDENEEEARMKKLMAEERDTGQSWATTPWKLGGDWFRIGEVLMRSMSPWRSTTSLVCSFACGVAIICFQNPWAVHT